MVAREVGLQVHSNDRSIYFNLLPILGDDHELHYPSQLVMPAEKHDYTSPNYVEPPFLFSKVPSKPSA